MRRGLLNVRHFENTMQCDHEMQRAHCDGKAQAKHGICIAFVSVNRTLSQTVLRWPTSAQNRAVSVPAAARGKATPSTWETSAVGISTRSIKPSTRVLSHLTLAVRSAMRRGARASTSRRRGKCVGSQTTALACKRRAVVCIDPCRAPLHVYSSTALPTVIAAIHPNNVAAVGDSQHWRNVLRWLGPRF